MIKSKELGNLSHKKFEITCIENGGSLYNGDGGGTSEYFINLKKKKRGNCKIGSIGKTVKSRKKEA
jgi:hypothetical protein